MVVYKSAMATAMVMVTVTVVRMVWQREDGGDGWESDLLLWGRPLLALPFG
jgi:hypothetical protein